MLHVLHKQSGGDRMLHPGNYRSYRSYELHIFHRSLRSLGGRYRERMFLSSLLQA